jgi:hypothetical protein
MGVRFGKELYGNPEPRAGSRPGACLRSLPLGSLPGVCPREPGPDCQRLWKSTANRTLNRHWSAGRAYQGVEVIVLKELGKITP